MQLAQKKDLRCLSHVLCAVLVGYILLVVNLRLLHRIVWLLLDSIQLKLAQREDKIWRMEVVILMLW